MAGSDTQFDSTRRFLQPRTGRRKQKPIDQWWVGMERHYQLVRDGHDMEVARVMPCEQGMDEQIARGYLIAAAPELLTACRAALAALEPMDIAREDGDDEMPIIRRLRAAIGKAAGK